MMLRFSVEDDVELAQRVHPKRCGELRMTWQRSRRAANVEKLHVHDPFGTPRARKEQVLHS